MRSSHGKGEFYMLLTTTEQIPGREYDLLGLVKGSTVQSKNLGRDLGASLKTLVGGEIRGYTQMMEEARAVATQRMIDEAAALGADAVIGVRYNSSSVMQGASEITAYGTAVRLR